MVDLMLSISTMGLAFLGYLLSKKVNKLEHELFKLKKGDNSDDCNN